MKTPPLSGKQAAIRPGGIKRFFNSHGTPSLEFEVNGIGILEQMHPSLIERPHGTGDFLFMLFHDEAHISDSHSLGGTHPARTMMIWPTGAPQFYGHRSQPYSHTWIHCRGSALRRMLKTRPLPLREPFHVSQPAIFQDALSEILSEMVAYTRPDPGIVQNLFQTCLFRLDRIRLAGSDKSHLPENLLAVQRLISSIPAEAITLEDMAKIAGMSPSYFCSQFKKAFGVSPMDSLIHNRMHRAAHLLTNWNLTISEIASQVGYEDLFQFSKMFKKKFGLSPRAMRQQIERSKATR